MATLNSTAFVAVTGNGLSVSEDLVRRFVICEFDARCANPEQRRFEAGFLRNIEDTRAELLAAALIIWRWGRQNAANLDPGLPLGSFENWAQWCRDPLLALGCSDPVDRIEMIKAEDAERRRMPVHVLGGVARRGGSSADLARSQPAAPGRGGLIEIGLGGEKWVRVDANVDAAALARVLDVLRLMI